MSALVFRFTGMQDDREGMQDDMEGMQDVWEGVQDDREGFQAKIALSFSCYCNLTANGLGQKERIK